MSRQSAGSTHRHSWISTAAWFAACLVLLVAYLVLRYAVDMHWALVLSQIVYLAPCLAAAVLSALAARMAPRPGRARLIWTLFAMGLLLLFVNEAINSADLIAGPPGDSAALPIGDALAAAATLVFLALIGTISSVDRLDRGRALRVVLDIMAIGALAFAVVFRFWVAGLLETLDYSQAVEAVRLAAYAAVGILVVIGSRVAVSRIRRHGTYRWATLMGAGMTVFGIGVALWPLWALRYFAGVGVWWHEPLVAATLLVGYELFGLGGLARVSDSHGPWFDGTHMPETGAVWPGLVATTAVFTSVLFLGWAVLDAPHGSSEQLVYLGVLSIAVLCLVSRTALSSAEMWRLQGVAATDALTGAHGQRLLDERVAQLETISRRSEVPFGMAVANLDDFSALNRGHGHDVGDKMLAAVTGALVKEVTAENVFRMAGDGFAILLPSATPLQAEQDAVRLLRAIDDVEVAGLRVSASIGTASFPQDAESGQDLLRKAEAAQIWAKFHGKHCVARYDQGLLRAAEGEGGYRLLETHGALEVALALVALTDARDPQDYRHSRNVAALARLLARYSGMDADAVDKLEIAAMMHDVGKLAIARTAAAGRNETARRRALDREHPVIGARLVGSLGIAELPEWIRSHHERWDGEGYPDGLVEREIPLGARIISLADAYDTMTEGTRTGLPMSKGAALQEIDLGIGTRFDPKLAELFISLVGSTERLGWAEEWTLA